MHFIVGQSPLVIIVFYHLGSPFLHSVRGFAREKFGYPSWESGRGEKFKFNLLRLYLLAIMSLTRSEEEERDGDDGQERSLTKTPVFFCPRISPFSGISRSLGRKQPIDRVNCCILVLNPSFFILLRCDSNDPPRLKMVNSQILIII